MYNTYIFVLALHTGVKDKPDHEREFFRFLLPAERLVAQGFPKGLRHELQSSSLAVKASGNAYPVPLIIANLHGMIACMATGGGLSQWPPPELVSGVAPPCLAQAMAAFKAPRKSLPKPSKPVHKKCMKRLKRKRSGSSE